MPILNLSSMESQPSCPFNVAAICRFCLSQTGVMSSIFDHSNGTVPSLTAKIMAIARIQIYYNDGLPSILCHRCLYLAEKSFDFKAQCEASDAMLRKYLQVMNNSIKSDSNDVIQIPQISISDQQNKRKRGRPRKEENLIFYSSPTPDGNPIDDESKTEADSFSNTVDDLKSDNQSVSDEESKRELDAEPEAEDVVARKELNQEREAEPHDPVRSLAIARAKAKKYMGVVMIKDEMGNSIRRHLCRGCGKTFGHCSDLRKHVLVHTGERPFHCQLCKKTFSRSTNLNKHLKVHSGQKPFSCTSCSKSFSTKGDLQRHLVIHSGVKPFCCHLCSQSFSRKDKLTRHLKLHELPSNLKVNQNAYFGHLLQPDGGPNFICEDADDEADDSLRQSKEDSSEISNDEEGNNAVKREVESMVINLDPFAVDSSLAGMNIGDENEDLEVDPAECPVRFQYFEDATNLPASVNVQANRPHKCNECGKSFSRRRELLRHSNVHTGLKPFCCEICSKAFARKDKLVRHAKTHNNVEKTPLQCHVCFVTFQQKDMLDRHLSTHEVWKGPEENGLKHGSEVGTDEEQDVNASPETCGIRQSAQ